MIRSKVMEVRDWSCKGNVFKMNKGFVGIGKFNIFKELKEG